MSTTTTIPAQLAPAVRNGLYEHLQNTYEALDHIILKPERDQPHKAVEQQALLDQFQAAAAALRAAGPATQPTGPLTISLIEHRTVLLKAVRAAAQTERHLTEELPEHSTRRQQARQTITALRHLSRQIKTQDTSSPVEDLYLQRLLILAVLNHRTGRTPKELHQALDDYPAKDVNDAAMYLTALGLFHQDPQRIHATRGLRRIDELDLICL